MRNILLSYFLLIISINLSNAQVLSLVPHPLQNYQHPFNEKFIKRNNISAIQVEISSKKEMDIIRAAHQFLVFEFNKDGKLMSEKKFEMGDVDTLNFAFEYNEDGSLILEQEFIGNGILEKKYTYGPDKKKKSIQYSKIDFFKNESNLISIDSIKNVTIDGTIIQTYYNDYGRAYREIRLYYDSLDYLTHYRETFIISHNQNTIDYSYNDYGLLKEIDYYFALSDTKRREEYIYNDEGVPDTFLIYENGNLTKRKEYLYNSDGSLNAILFKEMETNLITIWQFTYLKSY